MFAQTGKAAAATSLLLLCTTSAFAVDATAFSDRIKSLASQGDTQLTYDSAEADGDDVVMKGVSVKSGPNGQKIGDVTFKDVSGSDADGWSVKNVAIPDVEHKQGPYTTTVKNGTIDGLDIRGTATDVSSLPAAKHYTDFFFHNAHVDSIDVQKDGKSVFNAKALDVSNDLASDGTLKTASTVQSFHADLNSDPDDDAEKALEQMGYETIDGSFNGSVVWNPETGDLTLDPLKLSVENAGDLSFTYAISGYTPDLMASLQKVQKQMAANPDQRQQSGMALMGILSQLNLGKADITFVDHSLTNKLIDYFAKRDNQTHDDLVKKLTDKLPQAVSYIQDPKFQQDVTNAVTAFLQNPQSISIAVAPQKPIPATQIMGTVMTAPQTLPSVLSLNVKANEAGGSSSTGAN